MAERIRLLERDVADEEAKRAKLVSLLDQKGPSVGSHEKDSLRRRIAASEVARSKLKKEYDQKVT